MPSTIMSRNAREVRRNILYLCACLAGSAQTRGMWPFNQIPVEAINQKYKFEVSTGFADNLQVGKPSGSATDRAPLFRLPATALTNQHLVSKCLSQDQTKNGFYAAQESAEIRCQSMEASVLLGIEDVTAKVKAAGSTLQQRNAAIARIEQECGGRAATTVPSSCSSREDATTCIITSPYRKDLRMRFALESQLAFFGADRDSITYLRYGMDVAFLRAYENGRPADTPHYLKWSTEGIKDGDVVFASGDPQGTTSRLWTSAQLAFYRDTALPFTPESPGGGAHPGC